MVFSCFLDMNLLNASFDRNEKVGGCRFYQDALRSGIISEGKLTSVDGQA